MNHRYIDDHSIAQRYLANALSAEERDAFERHMVDCQDCTDRILLAGLFHAHAMNGVETHTNSTQANSTQQNLPQANLEQGSQNAWRDASQGEPQETSRNRPALILRLKRSTLVWAIVTGVVLLAAIPLAAWLIERSVRP